MNHKLLTIVKDRLYELLGIAPNDKLLDCLYIEIVNKNETLHDIVNITDDVLLRKYLALEEFFA